MPDGSYSPGAGQPIVVRDGRPPFWTALAGSSISLLEGVRRAVKFGIPLESAVYAASAAPAMAAGLPRVGWIAPGMDADLLLLDEQLQLEAVFIDGQLFKSEMEDKP